MNERNNQTVQIIENATRADVRPGDHITWERVTTIDGVTITTRYEGIARCRDEGGDWWTGEGMYITADDAATITIRRAVQELPEEDGAVIVPAEGREFIEAEVGGIAHRAREAVLGANGWWYGAWRKAEGDGLLSAMFPKHISAPTWKVDDQ